MAIDNGCVGRVVPANPNAAGRPTNGTDERLGATNEVESKGIAIKAGSVMPVFSNSSGNK